VSAVGPAGSKEAAGGAQARAGRKGDRPKLQRKRAASTEGSVRKYPDGGRDAKE